uniref:RING-type E3 ubiquitin transferase n=1 Tax=Chloropicon primus TaxID=1764295 RepID=A0A7S2T0G4_9CHLO|mmetsp:Transcript_13310/g.37350  ORF Transcript_13310/g.37350 Transcript_13310/m.37350 type:complete len:1048 (+) Transcript_13310:455-3598(+)
MSSSLDAGGAGGGDAACCSGMRDEGSEAEKVCRICRTSEEEEEEDGGKRRPLFYPCRCSGSIKYVHEECLVQWLKHSKRKKCEVCGTEYSFKNIYSDNAPRVLSLSEFITGLLQRLWQASRSCLRFVMVGFVWLAVVPLITSWVWRLCFARSTQQTILSIARRSCAFNLLLTDCVYGSFLSAAIVFVFLGTASLREYLRQIRFAPNGDGEEFPGQVGNGIRGGAPRAGNNEDIRALNMRLRDRLMGEEQFDAGGRRGRNDGGEFDGGEFMENWRLQLELERMRGLDEVGRNEEREGGVDLNDGGAQGREERNRVPDDPQLNNQNMGGLDLDRIEDVPFEELIGMQGPVLALFENATTILLSNLFFLVASVMLPFNIGRVCMSILAHLNIDIKSMDDNSVHSQVIHMSIEAMENLKDGISSEFDMSLGMAESRRSVNKLVRAATDFEAQLEPPTWKDLLTLGTGYLATLALGAAMCFVIIFFRCLRTYTHREESAHHRSLSIRELFMLVPIMAKRAYSYLAYSCVVLKVAFLLIVELGLFPIFFGLWLDLCSLPLFDAMLQTRMQFGLYAPITFTLIHWTLGILYMFLVSVSVSVLREILKPDVLAFLRDPADPNINPFRELFEDPFTKHVKKIAFGSIIYGSIAMVLVYMPVQFIKSIFPESFPIVIKLLDPLSELPIHLLMIHFGLPLTFEYLRPKRVIRLVIHSWLRYASKLFNVDGHILQNAGGQNAADADNTGGAGGERSFSDSGAGSSTPVVRTASANGTRKISDVRSFLARGFGIYRECWSLFLQSQFTLNIRLALLVLTSCLAVQLSNSILLSLPLFLGRQLCRLIGFPVHHDVYNILVGLYIVWGSFFSLSKWATIVQQVPYFVGGLVKYVVLGTLWLLVIPTILGTLVHLTFVVPFSVPMNHTPIFFIYQDWAIGLVSLKVLHWRNLKRYRHMWRSVEELWSNVGSPSNIDFRWALVEVTLPPLMNLCAQLCIPYTFVHSVLPMAGVSIYYRHFLYRYGYPLLALGHWKHYVTKSLWRLHNAIRDDKYLVGKALKNFA